MKALAKDPNERLQTACEFARSLKEAVEKPPPPAAVETEPPKPPGKPFLSRKVLLLATVLLLLVAGGWWAAGHFDPSPNTSITGNSSGAGQGNPTDGQPGVGAASGTNNQAKLPGTANSPGGTSSTPTLGVDLKVELEQEGKGVVSPEMSFRSGDAVRLIASPNQTGRVYLVMKGTTGPAEILYPDAQIKGSYGAVQADQRVEAPPSNGKRPWFKFDNQPGVETLYIVFATQEGDERLQSLESAVRKKRRHLNDVEERQTMAAMEALVAGQSASSAVVVKKILLRHKK
jgi:hypothetical protein